MTRQCAWCSCDPSWFIECVTCSNIIDKCFGFLVGLIWFIECCTTTFLHTHHSLLAKTWLMRMIDEDEVDLKEQSEDTRYIKKIMQTLPLLGAADSETGRVVTPWRVMGGVKSIPRRTTYHRTSLPGFWVDGNKYILVQFLVCQISSLQVVDNVISSTRITGPLHHSSQLLFMITLFNQLWSVVIITNNSTNFLRERDESKN